VSQYATIAELYQYGAPSKAFGALDAGTLNAGLAAASAEVDSMLRGRYSLPLLTWDESIKRWTCQIAAYQLLAVRGFDPRAGGDANLLARYDQAMRELGEVQRQARHPLVTETPIASSTYVTPLVISSSTLRTGAPQTATNRGW
jgi:phage gp36-like protein